VTTSDNGFLYLEFWATLYTFTCTKDILTISIHIAVLFVQVLTLYNNSSNLQIAL